MPRDFNKSALSKWICFLLLISLLGCQGVVKEIIHGVEITDPYRWLEDGNSKRTRQWIEKQNEYAKAVVDSLPNREELKQRITELMRTDRVYWPTVRNGRYFFYKQSSNHELFTICMRKGLEGEDEVLINPHPLSPDHTTSVLIQNISEDASVMAYGVRQGGETEYVVKLFDIEKRKDLTDYLGKKQNYDRQVSLMPDSTGFYYVRRGTDGDQIYYHAMGTEPSRDIDLFGKGYGPGRFWAGLSEDGRYLLIHALHDSAVMKSATRSEVYYQNVAEKGPIVTIVNDIEARFDGQVAGDNLFLKTNWEAPNERILRVDLTNPARENWQEIIPECDSVLERFSLAGGKLLVTYMHNCSSQIKVYEPDGKFIRDIQLPAIGSAWTSGRWDSNEVFLTFESFHIPPIIYRYDVDKDKKEVWWQTNVPIDSSMYEVKQVWYKSKDGTKVPMFIVHAKGTKLDGQNPTFLTAYGGFNHSLPPKFLADLALWLEAGGVYAQPNLRGGGEFGEEWHKSGMFEKKQNVFDDFIAAAEWLIDNDYTSPTKLAISGTSNGGLLVGAVITQRPELFQAVVCSYPLLDMVRYHKFGAAGYYAREYGSPENPEQFKYIYAYSPYHRVKQGTEYPAVLFITGDLDTIVDPLHARKMTALLQSATGSDRPVLLQYHAKAGHSGGRPMSKQIEDTTDIFSFLFWQLGINFYEPNSLSALSSSRQ